MKGLNEKQIRFCQEYIIDFHVTNAAKRAGYSEKTSHVIGSELLKKPEIANEIQKQLERRSKRTEVTQDRVLLEIARLAFNDPRKAFDENSQLLPVKQWSDDVAAAISTIKVKEEFSKEGELIGYLKEVRFWDKGKQIELAAKYLGMLGDNKKDDDLPPAATPEFNVADKRIDAGN